MKLAALILTVASATAPSTQIPEVTLPLPDDIARACAAEGGCTLMTQMSLDRLTSLAFAAGEAHANQSCRKGRNDV